MKEVYCKNCKHYFDGDCCYREINKFTNQITYIGRPSDNENGDCKNYKKKWWKFWVKNESKNKYMVS